MITGNQLLDVFAQYNQQIWPMQIAAYLFGIISAYLAVRKTKISERGIQAILGFFWLWVGMLFWFPSVLQGFVPGILFTVLFLIQGGLFVFFALKSELTFGFKNDIKSWLGIFFVLYALVGYPLVGLMVGRSYPSMPSFGLTPCPLVTFTFGLFLLAERRLPRYLLIIPLFYALSGFLWVSIGIIEDTGLIASGLLASILIWYRDSRSPQPQTGSDNEASEGGWSLDLPNQK